MEVRLEPTQVEHPSRAGSWPYPQISDLVETQADNRLGQIRESPVIQQAFQLSLICGSKAGAYPIREPLKGMSMALLANIRLH